ncbi:MAG TPA: hypothetical protein VEL73_08155 [Mycobacteriales bacterium]|nr:hypothetical protein [Mycobacteriales bacterium]
MAASSGGVATVPSERSADGTVLDPPEDTAASREGTERGAATDGAGSSGGETATAGQRATSERAGRTGGGRRATVPGSEDSPTGPAARDGERRRWGLRPGREGSGRSSGLAVVLLTVAAVALAALALVLVQGQRRTTARADAEQAVLVPAKTAAARILSYDYRHLPQDTDAASHLLTGTYKGQYEDAMRRLIVPQAPKQQAVVSAEVLSAGVSSVNRDGDQAVVVVFANQTVSTTSLTQPRVDQLRVRLTLDRVDGRWLVSKVDAL